MGAIKGQAEYEKFLNKRALTRKQSILAQCYMCNGLEESREDCRGSESCPLYQHSIYRGSLALKPRTPSQVAAYQKAGERLKLGRMSKKTL